MMFFSWSVGEQNILSVFWRTYMSASTCSRVLRHTWTKWKKCNASTLSGKWLVGRVFFTIKNFCEDILAVNHFCVLLKSPDEHLHHPVATTISGTLRYELTRPFVVFKRIHHDDTHRLLCQPLTHALQRHRKELSQQLAQRKRKDRSYKSREFFNLFHTSDTADETSAMKSLSSLAYLRMVWSKTKTAGRNPSLPTEQGPSRAQRKQNIAKTNVSVFCCTVLLQNRKMTNKEATWALTEELCLTERCDPSLFATRGTSRSRRPVFQSTLRF